LFVSLLSVAEKEGDAAIIAYAILSAAISARNLQTAQPAAKATPRVAQPLPKWHSRALVAWRGPTNGNALVKFPPTNKKYLGRNKTNAQPATQATPRVA